MAHSHAIAEAGYPNLVVSVGVEEDPFGLAEPVRIDPDEGGVGGDGIGGVPEAVGLRGDVEFGGVFRVDGAGRDAVVGEDLGPRLAAVGRLVEAAPVVGLTSPAAEYADVPGVLA